MFDVANLNETVEHLESSVFRRVELIANTSQTIRELEFFCL